MTSAATVELMDRYAMARATYPERFGVGRVGDPSTLYWAPLGKYVADMNRDEIANVSKWIDAAVEDARKSRERREKFQVEVERARFERSIRWPSLREILGIA